MRKHTLSILLIAVLGGAGAASAQPAQKSPDPSAERSAPRDDVQITVTASKGRLGISVLQISPELRAHFGAPTDRGVLIDAVRPDGPAARAGLRVGDVVTDANGKPTQSASDVLDALADRKKGDEITITAIRGGHRLELRAKLDNDPGVRWQSKGVHRFEGFPDDLGTWFPGQGDPRELRDAIEELQNRMDKLERQLAHPPTHGTDRT
jgi:membrane-associated protease RseP (regulator of RpoE activity)